jgi:hypothetical protein
LWQQVTQLSVCWHRAAVERFGAGLGCKSGDKPLPVGWGCGIADFFQLVNPRVQQELNCDMIVVWLRHYVMHSAMPSLIHIRGIEHLSKQKP